MGYYRGRGGGGAVVESYILKRRGYFGDNITQYVKVSSIIQPLQVILEIIYPNTSRYLQSFNLYRLFWRLYIPIRQGIFNHSTFIILEIIYPNTSRYLQSFNLYRLFWRLYIPIRQGIFNHSTFTGYFGDYISQYVKVSSIIQPLQVILEIILYPNTSRYLQSFNLYRVFWR